MRALSGILFILGIPWALIAWIAIFGGPAAVFEELSAGRVIDALGMVLFWLVFAAHVAVGYFIWGRWLSIMRGRGIASRRFWLVAAAHHFGWIVFLYLQNAPIPSLISLYAVMVLIACLVAAVVAHRKPLAVAALPS